MKKIKQTTIDNVNQYLLEVIEYYVDLKRRGTNYVGLSPFQAEKTPSFVVSPSKNIWKDFSSGKGGNNPINFVMELEGLTFPEAIERCASILDIPIEYEENDTNDNSFYKEAILSLNSFFKDNLKLNKNAISYIYSRGINDDSIELWEIGYAPEYSKSIEFFNNSYYKNELLELKLFGINNKTGKVFPKFANRVMFPIKNHYGKLVGFSGRDISGKMKSKYVNSSDSILFQKGKILFGFDKINTSVKKVILVEGQIDVILLHQYGLKVGVAAQGTGFTQYQYNLIKDYKTMLCFDGDDAGLKATFRTNNLFLKNGKIVKITILPKGTDVADILTRNGIKEMLNVLAKHTDGPSFLVDYLTKTTNPEEKVKGLNKIKEHIKEFPYPIREEVIDRYIAATNGNVEINDQKQDITIEEAAIIKYALLTNKKQDIIKKYERCFRIKLQDKSFNKVKYAPDLSSEEFDLMLSSFIINCLNIKKQTIKNNNNLTYQEKKELIRNIEKEIEDAKYI
jgi:DNA primase